MALFEITAPDGKLYEITAPDGTTEQEALTALQKHLGGTVESAPAVKEQPGMLADAAKSAGAGLVRGAAGLVGLPGTIEQLGRMGINAAARAAGKGELVSPEPALASGADVTRMVEDFTGPLHKPQTTVGRYANAIGEFAPGALFPGGVAQRVLGNVVGPAVVSETAGEATKGTSLEPVARIGGALAGGGLANIAARAYTPVPTSAPRQAAVQTLRNEGVDALSAGEVTGSKPLRYLEQHASDIPFSGGRAGTQSERAAEQFTAATLRRAGIQAPRATQDVIDAAFTQQGARFDQLAQASTARMTQADAQRIADAIRRYEGLTPPTNQIPFIRDIAADLVTHAGNPIAGPVYQRYRSAIEEAARSAADPVAANALRQIRNTLDDAVERGLPQRMQGQWREVRNHYRNLLVVAKASAAGGENAANGLISPAQLAIATKTVQGARNFERGRGDYARLARAGQAVMSPLPNSGTPARLAAGAVGAGIGQAVGGIAAGAPGMGLGAIMGPLGAAAMARAFMSAPVQRYLGANGRMQPMTINGRAGGVRALPAAVGGLLED